jgi:hypothetical protein
MQRNDSSYVKGNKKIKCDTKKYNLTCKTTFFSFQLFFSIRKRSDDVSKCPGKNTIFQESVEALLFQIDFVNLLTILPFFKKFKNNLPKLFLCFLEK